MSNANVENRIHSLVQEVMSGEHPMDTLPNASKDFSNEVQAIYFSNTRRNMESDLFHIIAYEKQQLGK